MMPLIKAEFRKLLSIRTTYVFTGLAILFVLFYAGYIEGFKLAGADLQDPGLLSSDVTGALNSLPIVFGAIVAILLMTHEYRYNTIMYALTLSNRRTKVLLAKFVTVTVYALVLSAVVGFLSPAVSYLGIHLHGHTLIAQQIDYGSLIWRGLYEGWAYIIAGLLLATLIRNQIGAIVSLFVIPTFEQVLTLLLKDKAVYLPFNSLSAVITKPAHGSLSSGHAAIVFTAYLAVGWLVAWYLFMRRDAN